jgi:hypothetical protein
MFAFRFLQEGEIALAKCCCDSKTGLQERTVPAISLLSPHFILSSWQGRAIK